MTTVSASESSQGVGFNVIGNEWSEKYILHLKGTITKETKCYAQASKHKSGETDHF